jgi:hypothetical protein
MLLLLLLLLLRCRPDGSYEYAYNVTNVEYTEFGRLGVSDECADGSQLSRYPANTNVLYVGLKAWAHSLRGFRVLQTLQLPRLNC